MKRLYSLIKASMSSDMSLFKIKTNKNNELNINSKTYSLNILINKTVRLGIGKDNNNWSSLQLNINGPDLYIPSKKVIIEIDNTNNDNNI